MNIATRGRLIGMVFGDAYINVRKRMKGKYSYISSEMTIVHSPKQSEYCEHKASLVRHDLHHNFSVIHSDNVGPQKKYKQVRFSVSHPYFKQLKRWCYPHGVKTFTKQTLNMLTPEGIALWYMDDGHARININSQGKVSSVATELSTMCSKEETELIKQWFFNNFNVLFNIRFDGRCREGKQFFLQANTEASREFVRIIDPFVIPSMRYKIAHVKDLDSHECRTPIDNCSHCEGIIYSKRYGGLCSSCYSSRHYSHIRRFKEEREPFAKSKGDEIVRTCKNNELHEA